MTASTIEDAWLEAAYPDADCGCPVEEWVCAGVNLTLHYEANGAMEVSATNGDWEHKFALAATTMEAARAEAFGWARGLPCSD